MDAELSPSQPKKPTPENTLLLPHEVLDISILDKFVKPLYQPRATPLAMCVGYSLVREGMILRGFHELSYQFNYDTPLVVACNQRDIPVAGTTDRLNKLYTGAAYGNAEDPTTWLAAFTYLGINDHFSYDLSYIRNPDLLDITLWAKVFLQAVEMTAPTGVVVTLIRLDDVTKFDKLCNRLEDDYQIVPALVTETKMNIDNDPLRQHHLLAVFKGEAGARRRGESI